MKLSATLLILGFSMLSLSAQNKWSFGASVQGGYSGYSSTHTESHLLSGTTTNTISYQEKRQPSVGFGLWWSKRWSDKWSLNGGVDYVWSGAYIAYDFSSKLLNGTPLNYSLDVYKLHQQQLQFPVGIRYSIGRSNRLFRPFIGAGLQLKFLRFQDREQRLTLVTGLQDGDNFLEKREVNFKNDFPYVSRFQFAAQAEVGVKNDYVSLSIRTGYPLQSGAVKEKAARRNYICCLEEELSNHFINNGAFLLLQQTSLVFQYRLF